MGTVLSGVERAQVVHDPFPYVVVRDVFDDDLVRALIDEYPSTTTVSQGAELHSNQRFSLGASDALADPDVSETWKSCIRAHTSAAFLREVLDVFAGVVPPGALPSTAEDLRVGVRHVDDFPDVDVLLDAQICVNTPVTDGPSSVRGAHVDLPSKLFAGLFYLRHPDDDSTGGDLEIYRPRRGLRHFRGQFFDQRQVELVASVPYERNVLVLFVNSIAALHGVTVRSETPWPRHFLNLLGEVRAPMFDLDVYRPRFAGVMRLERRIRS